MPVEQVDPILYNKAYYLEPDQTAAKPYALLREAVRDEGRKAQVLANVARLAREHDVPAQAAAGLYERLVEASIAYELGRFDATRR